MTDTPPPSAHPGGAVFLSYASQDAVAAKRLCEALRAAGVEVWFDQSELVGGDAWDRKIRQQIASCALFVPVISANTNARSEGYFRLEWKLAVDRSHLMADDEPFLVPVVIDDTPEPAARVPDRFREVQWIRLRPVGFGGQARLPGSGFGGQARLPGSGFGGQARLPGSGAGGQARLPESGVDEQALAERIQALLNRADDPVVASRPAVKAGGKKASRSESFWRSKIVPILGVAVGLAFTLRMMWHPDSTGRSEAKPVPAAAATSEAEGVQLARKARALYEKVDSTPDDFALAEGYVKRALELAPHAAEVLAVSSRLNSLYGSRGFDHSTQRREVARSHAERAVKLAPDSVEALHALGRALMTSEPARAEDLLRQAAARAPGDGRILISLGSLHRRHDRLDEALRFYELAAAVPESRALANFDQFLIHFGLRRFPEADRCIRKAVAETPSTNFVAGQAQLLATWRGDLEEAARVLSITPRSTEHRTVLIATLVHLMRRRPDEALAALNRLTDDYLQDNLLSAPKAHLVGNAHQVAGRTEAARVAWEAGLTIMERRMRDAPGSAQLHLRRGELLALLGRTEEALREARVVDEMNSGQGASNWTYSNARIFAALGRTDETLPEIERLLRATGSGGWPLTPALLRFDPLWDKLRGDARFQRLIADPDLP